MLNILWIELKKKKKKNLHVIRPNTIKYKQNEQFFQTSQKFQSQEVQ
jgi:hypothetical protein